MLNVLSRFYNGNLIPCEFAPPTSKNYKLELQKSSNLREELMKTLNEQQKEILDEYVSMSLLAQSRVLEQQFLDGLAIGMSMSEELEEYKRNILNRFQN